MFDTALAHWMGMDQAGLCVHARTCGDAVALEHNGDLYSCDHYVEPGYLLGNIAEGRTLLELVNLPAAAGLRAGQARHAARVLPVVRRAVRLQRRLPQGPVHSRTPDGEPGLHYLCAGYKDFFHHVDGPMRVMASLLRQGRDATGLRDWYAVRDAKRAVRRPVHLRRRAHLRRVPRRAASLSGSAAGAVQSGRSASASRMTSKPSACCGQPGPTDSLTSTMRERGLSRRTRARHS